MEQQSKQEKLHFLKLQDLLDIKALIEGAPITFAQARRAVEIQVKLDEAIKMRQSEDDSE